VSAILPFDRTDLRKRKSLKGKKAAVLLGGRGSEKTTAWISDVRTLCFGRQDIKNGRPGSGGTVLKRALHPVDL